MTTFTCFRCKKNSDFCTCLAGPKHAPQRALLAIYTELRSNCVAMEELVERCAADAESVFNADDLKRLDKAITVMKVAFKIVKKTIRANGVDGVKKWRDDKAPEASERITNEDAES